MAKERKPKVRLILYDSYIKAIENSVGSNLFRNLYAYVDDKKTDILKNGELSCATFVSSVLLIFKLASDTHATVKGTVEDLVKSGWRETKKPKSGAILVWQDKIFDDGSIHKHIGFYIGSNKAISNNSSKHIPAVHHWTYGTKNGQPARKIEKIFWHNKLNG